MQTQRHADAAATEAPDEALLVGFANGDSEAGQILLSRLAPRLFSYASRVLGDSAEAEDVVQETIMRLWKIAPNWRQGEAQVFTWTYRVAGNLCTDRLRKRRPHAAMDGIAEQADSLPDAVTQMTEVERTNALQTALTSLPDRQRQAVVLRHLEGLSNPQIAAIMDLSVEAVESLTSRGKRALKLALQGRKEELGYTDG